MDEQPAALVTEIEQALANFAMRISPEQYTFVRQIIYTNLSRARLKYFLNKHPGHAPTDYVEHVVETYLRLTDYLTQVQVKKTEEVWEPLFERIKKWCGRFLIKNGFSYKPETNELIYEYAQEAALALVHARFPYDTEFDPWAVVIVHNVCLKRMRDDTRHLATRSGTVSIEDEKVVELNKQLQGNIVEQTDTMQDVLAGLKQLSKTQQQIIFLFYREGLTPADIADQLGQTQSTIYRLKFEALKELRKILVQNGYK